MQLITVNTQPYEHQAIMDIPLLHTPSYMYYGQMMNPWQKF